MNRAERPRRRLLLPLDLDLHCPQCGYDLRGIPEDRCPECGFGFDLPALRDLTQRTALNLMEIYVSIAWRGLLLVGFSVVLTLWPPVRVLGGGLLLGPVLLVAAVLYWHYGAPRTWTELLIDWGLPLLLLSRLAGSRTLYELAQWALVAEMAVGLLSARRLQKGLYAALDPPRAHGLRRERSKAIAALGVGAAIAMVL